MASNQNQASYTAGETKGRTEEKTGQMMGATKDKAGHATEATKQKTGETTEAAKQKAGQTTEAAKQKAGEAKDKTAQTAQAAKDKTAQTAQAAKDKTVESKDQTGTQLLSTTMGVKEYVQSEFDNVEAQIIAPNKDLFPGTITCDDFLWAFGVLRSRVFPELRGDKLALIPFADLINHSGDITSKEPCWEIKGKGFLGRDVVFSLRTPLEVKSGEQVYVQYDLDKSNAELALDYGFTEWNSSRDSYTLTLEISESDPFYGDKLDIAELNGMGETAYFDIVLGESLPPQMIPYLRLLCLGGTDAFLLEALFRNKVWEHLELPVSRDNEESICQVIQKACKSALAAYHTTIEEDEELLEREDLQSRHLIAIEVRIGEKKVLQQINDIFKEREQELDDLEYYQERRLKDLGFLGDNGEIIFWES